MAQTLQQLIQMGAIEYALGRLTRGATTGDILNRLLTRFPGTDLSFLERIIEYAQQEVIVRSQLMNLASQDIIDGFDLPEVDDVPAGEFDIGFSVEIPIPGIGRSQSGFIRTTITPQQIRFFAVAIAFDYAGKEPPPYAKIIESITPPNPLPGKGIKDYFPELNEPGLQLPPGATEPFEKPNKITPEIVKRKIDDTVDEIEQEEEEINSPEEEDDEDNFPRYQIHDIYFSGQKV